MASEVQGNGHEDSLSPGRLMCAMRGLGDQGLALEETMVSAGRQLMFSAYGQTQRRPRVFSKSRSVVFVWKTCKTPPERFKKCSGILILRY